MNPRIEKLAMKYLKEVICDNDNECKYAYLAGYRQAISDATEVAQTETESIRVQEPHENISHWHGRQFGALTIIEKIKALSED